MAVYSEVTTNLNSKAELKEITSKQNYCSDCLYDWCSKRNKVSFCTMKHKGFFECRSCMIKLLKKTSSQ